MMAPSLVVQTLVCPCPVSILPRLSGPSWMRWELGQLEDAPSLGFSKHFLEHPCATSRGPHAYPTHHAWLLPTVCVWGRAAGSLITARSLALGWHHICKGLGCPKEGSVSQALWMAVQREYKGGRPGVHELRLDGQWESGPC